MAVSLDI